MSNGDLTDVRLRRVKPYQGLVIDAETWAEAHDYHREQLRLHNQAFHATGILVGLRVRAAQGAEASVIVSPGVAVDDVGNMIVVGQERSQPLGKVGPGTVYVVLTYRETQVNVDPDALAGSAANRVVETYDIDALDKLPEDEQHLELARVQRSAKDAGVRDATHQEAPELDEVDLRFRGQAVGSRPPLVRAGFAMLGETAEVTAPHTRGIQHLLQEIGASRTAEVAFGGVVPLAQGTGDCTFLYLARSGPKQPTDAEIAALASLLNRGGVLLAEHCAATGTGAAGAFVKSMRKLAKALDLEPAPLAPESPLLTSRYVFGGPPPGAAADGEVLADGGFIISTRDYACAWSGLSNGAPLAREDIRSALEFGVNLAALSARSAISE